MKKKTSLSFTITKNLNMCDMHQIKAEFYLSIIPHLHKYSIYIFDLSNQKIALYVTPP